MVSELSLASDHLSPNIIFSVRCLTVKRCCGVVGEGCQWQALPSSVQCKETTTRTRNLPVTGGKTLPLAPGPHFETKNCIPVRILVRLIQFPLICSVRENRLKLDQPKVLKTKSCSAILRWEDYEIMVLASSSLSQGTSSLPIHLNPCGHAKTFRVRISDRHLSFSFV